MLFIGFTFLISCAIAVFLRQNNDLFKFTLIWLIVTFVMSAIIGAITQKSVSKELTEKHPQKQFYEYEDIQKALFFNIPLVAFGILYEFLIVGSVITLYNVFVGNIASFAIAIPITLIIIYEAFFTIYCFITTNKKRRILFVYIYYKCWFLNKLSGFFLMIVFLLFLFPLAMLYLFGKLMSWIIFGWK